MTKINEQYIYILFTIIDVPVKKNENQIGLDVAISCCVVVIYSNSFSEALLLTTTAS